MQKTFSLSTDDLDDKWVVSQYRAHHTAERLSNTSGLDFESLGEVSRITSGSYVRDYAPEGTPYIRVDNVRHHVFNLTEEDLEYLPKYEVDDLTDRCFCQTDDIIIGRTGTLGKAVLVLQPQSGMALSQHTTRIIADKSSVLPAYLCLYLNSPTGSTALDNLGAGSTRSELTHAELEKLQLPVAPTHVQEEYGQRLRDALENYYESVSNLRSLYREVDRFLGHHESGAEEPIAYDIGYDELRDLWNPSLYQPEMIKGYKEVVSNFDTIEIGDFAEVSRGKGTKTEEYSEEGFPFLRTSSLINGSVDPFPDHYADDEVYSRFDQPIEDGDILFSIEGKIGQSAMLMERMQVVFKNHIEIIRTREIPPHLTFSEMTGWVLAVLNSKYGEGLVDMNSVVQSTISGLASRLRSFPIPISPTDDRSVDKIKSIGNRVFEETGSLIDSLIKLQGTQESFNEYLKSNGIG